jgi:hypothetical protein
MKKVTKREPRKKRKEFIKKNSIILCSPNKRLVKSAERHLILTKIGEPIEGLIEFTRDKYQLSYENADREVKKALKNVIKIN